LISYNLELETLAVEGDQRFVPVYGKKRNHGYSWEGSSGSGQTDSDEFEHPRKTAREYLSWFSEAKQLSLTYIKFTDLEVMPFYLNEQNTNMYLITTFFILNL
jgi:hypothetical protein